jgi:hypothetical protein
MRPLWHLLSQRLRLYGRLAKGTALVAFWAAAAADCALVLGARLGIASHVDACQSPYCDLSAFWQAARMAASGYAAQAYDPAAFLALRAALLGPAAGDLFWFYTPPALLAVAGLAHLPLPTAFWVWTIGLSGVALSLLRAAGINAAVIALGLFSPAALWNTELGQFGALTGSALIVSLTARPLPAGLALGLLVIKPQAGLLAPIALLAARRWRSVLVAAGAGTALLAVSSLSLGAAVWRAYLGPGLALSQDMLVRLSVTPGTAQFGVSVFGMLRSGGAAPAMAGAAQALASLGAVGATAWLWWRPGTPRRVLCTAILALLATPYGYVDDMVGVSLALAMVVQARGWRFSLTDVLLFTWPVLGPVVYGAIGLQVTPLLLCLALWRSGAGSRPETAPGSADRPADAPAAGRT